MPNSGINLKTLSLFERKEYEELKHRYSIEAKKLRQQKVFIGFAVVAFISVLAMCHFFTQ